MITLSQANVILKAALDHARGAGMPPMTVAVLDAGGHLVAFSREDESSLFREKISRAKATGALGLGAGSRGFTALTAITEGAIAPVPGGVLIRSAEGKILGAVGVSGSLPDHDEACAIQGIEAASLTADPGG